MAKYKIINLTNLLGKRDSKYNKVVNIKYIHGVERKNIGIIPGDTLFIELQSVPIEIQRLRLNGYIIIEQISDIQFDNERLYKNIQPIVVVEPTAISVVMDDLVDDGETIEKPNKKTK